MSEDTGQRPVAWEGWHATITGERPRGALPGFVDVQEYEADEPGRDYSMTPAEAEKHGHALIMAAAVARGERGHTAALNRVAVALGAPFNRLTNPSPDDLRVLCDEWADMAREIAGMVDTPMGKPMHATLPAAVRAVVDERDRLRAELTTAREHMAEIRKALGVEGTGSAAAAVEALRDRLAEAGERSADAGVERLHAELTTAKAALADARTEAAAHSGIVGRVRDEARAECDRLRAMLAELQEAADAAAEACGVAVVGHVPEAWRLLSDARDEAVAGRDAAREALAAAREALDVVGNGSPVLAAWSLRHECSALREDLAAAEAARAEAAQEAARLRAALKQARIWLADAYAVGPVEDYRAVLAMCDSALAASAHDTVAEACADCEARLAEVVAPLWDAVSGSAGISPWSPPQVVEQACKLLAMWRSDEAEVADVVAPLREALGCVGAECDWGPREVVRVACDKLREWPDALAAVVAPLRDALRVGDLDPSTLSPADVVSHTLFRLGLREGAKPTPKPMTHMLPRRHPDQRTEHAPDGVLRFRKNAIVLHLLDNGPFDMNALARLDFDDEDRAQFAQLIGYSVDGYESLSYALPLDGERPKPAREPMTHTSLASIELHGVVVGDRITLASDARWARVGNIISNKGLLMSWSAAGAMRGAAFKSAVVEAHDAD